MDATNTQSPGPKAQARTFEESDELRMMSDEARAEADRSLELGATGPAMCGAVVAAIGRESVGETTGAMSAAPAGARPGPAGRAQAGAEAREQTSLSLPAGLGARTGPAAGLLLG